MKKPPVVQPDDDVTTLGRVFGTPVVVKGWTWLPLAEVIVWGFMAWVAGQRRPARSWRARLGVGLVTMPIVVGLEWCHNFMHAAAARLVGRPMDALRITWGTPLCVYFALEDPTVTPRQHVVRALGGPVVNALLLVPSLLLRRLTRPDSLARDMTDAACGMNGFLSTVSLLPLPGIDGGPILKWSLVERGWATGEADLAVRKVDGVLGVALSATGALALRQRQWSLGAAILPFAALSLAIATGLLRE